jgi:hypothetical protein
MAVPVVVILAGIAGALLTLTARQSLNYNEGWNALQVVHVLNGENPYQSNLTGWFFNYPPLSAYLVAAISRFGLDAIFVGRAISLVSLGVIAVNLFCTARLLGAGHGPSAFSALLAPATVILAAPGYIGMNDPQLLASAIQTTALPLLLIWFERRQSKYVIAAAVVMLVAGWTKHNLVAFPIGATLWLALCDRRALAIWLGTWAVAGVASLAAAQACFGPAFLDQVLFHRRVITVERALGRLFAVLIYAGLVISGGVGFLAAKTAASSLLFISGVIALAAGIYFMSGDGVSANVLFDVAFAFSPLVALAVSNGGHARLRSACAVLVLIPLLAGLPNGQRVFAQRMGIAQDPERYETAIAKIASAPGPVACEILALCYWANRQSELDFFNFGQVRKTDTLAMAAFVETLRSGRFALIQAQKSTAFGAQAAAAFKKSYNVVMDRPVRLWASVDVPSADR